MMDHNNILSVVLAGGKSKRFGEDKSQAKLGEKMLIDYILSQLIDEFNDLMKKSSNDMIKLASIIENTDDVKASLGKLMWGNCKACHSKFRAPH